jgi:hypothetical protein
MPTKVFDAIRWSGPPVGVNGANRRRGQRLRYPLAAATICRWRPAGGKDGRHGGRTLECCRLPRASRYLERTLWLSDAAAI